MEIIGFGDSWVAGHGVEIDERYSDVPNEKIPDDILKVRLNGSLISQLANKLGFTWKNYGLCGASNSEIYNSFVEWYNDVETKGYVVIVGFTITSRDVIPSKTEKERGVNRELIDESEQIAHLLFIYDRILNLCRDKNIGCIFFNAWDSSLDSEYENFWKPSDTMANFLLEKEKNVWQYEWGKKDYYKLIGTRGGWHPNIKGYKYITEELYNFGLELKIW